MSNYDSDPSYDGDWEDRGGLIWNEYDWRKYLKESDKEIARFLSIYNSLKDQPDHLDETAHLMGWEIDDWSTAIDLEDGQEAEETLSFDPHEEEPDFDDLEPYTLHKHPVFVVTRALHEYLRHNWEQYMTHGQQNISNQVAWAFANSLNRSEVHAILALQSLDLGDFALTTCHLKTALSALNQSLATLQNLTHRNGKFLALFQHEMNIRIFDLREIWLRVMEDCRDEVRRRNEGRR